MVYGCVKLDEVVWQEGTYRRLLAYAYVNMNFSSHVEAWLRLGGIILIHKALISQPRSGLLHFVWEYSLICTYPFYLSGSTVFINVHLLLYHYDLRFTGCDT